MLFNGMSSVMLTPTIIVTLLSTYAWCHDGVHLIDRLNDFYGFDHNIFFLGSSTELDDWLPVPSSSRSEARVGSFTPQTVYVFNDDFAESNFNVTERKCNKNTFLIVVAGGAEIGNDSQLLAEVMAIRYIGTKVRIGVFLTDHIDSLDVVDELFRWSWSIGVVNIFSAFYFSVEDEEPVFNVFKYNPFTAFELINVTRSKHLRIYFTDERPNYRQNPLRFLVLSDSTVTIDEIEFWRIVCRLFNASAELIQMTHAEHFKSGISHADILLHNNMMTEFSPKRLYPYRQTMLAALVPHSQPYSDFVTYLKNDTWTHLLVYTSILILASSFLLILSGYLNKKKILLFQCIADVINLLMNDNSAIRYRNLNRADVFVVVPLTFTGLIVVNGILSVFQSYMTWPIYQPQINSVKDLYTSTVPILANEVGWKDWFAMSLEDSTNFGGWIDKIHGVTFDQLTLEENKFNNSIALFMLNSNAQRFLEAQKRLGLKAYHVLSEIPFPRYPVYFQLKSNFNFVEPIEDIIHRLNGAGLIDKWLEAQNDLAVKNLVNKNIQKRNHNKLDVNDEFAVPTLVWCGWIMSAVTFVCEVIWNKIKLSVRSRNECVI